MARLVFDLDGTLLDSAPSLAAAGNRLLAELGRPPVDVATYTGFVGNGMRMQVERLLAATGGVPAPGLDAHLERFMAHYEADPVRATQPYSGVADALARLAPAHALGVATQKPAAAARKVLDAFRILHHFAAVTGGDMVARLKPDPEMLTRTAEALGQGPVLFIGDSDVDRETARAAGVPFVLHEKGYRRRSVADLAPEGRFEHFDRLPGVVARLLPRVA